MKESPKFIEIKKYHYSIYILEYEFEQLVTSQMHITLIESHITNNTWDQTKPIAQTTSFRFPTNLIHTNTGYNITNMIHICITLPSQMCVESFRSLHF